MNKDIQYYIMESDKNPIACYALGKSNDGICYLERLAVLGRLMIASAANAKNMNANHIEIGIIAYDYKLLRFL